MEISAIIIEDEEISRLTLRSYLTRYCPQVKLLGEAGDIREGKKLIDKHHPELIFLDIEMPFGTGFDLLEQFDKIWIDCLNGDSRETGSRKMMT